MKRIGLLRGSVCKCLYGIMEWMACPHHVRGTQDRCLSLCQTPDWSHWDCLCFSFCSQLLTWIAKKKKKNLKRKCKWSRDLREDLPQRSLGKQLQTAMTPFFTIRLAKILKRLATSKCWQGGEEVYSLPVLLEGVWIATMFGERLLVVFINSKNTHLLTIKKQSYFGDFILQK